MENKKTRISFELYNYGNFNYCVDPNSIIINGPVLNWNYLNDILFNKENTNLFELTKELENEKPYLVELDIFLDYDDHQSWIDFDLVSTKKLN